MKELLRLALHAELPPAQQQQAARIYLDERNWSIILNNDLAHRGYYPYSLEEAVKLIVDDAKNRDSIFPDGQLVLLARESAKEEVKEQEKEATKEGGRGPAQEQLWHPIGSIHTIISSDEHVKATFTADDTWNAFTDYGQLSAKQFDPAGQRWVCFAIQTDQNLDKNKWPIKPADLIIKGVRVLAFADNNEYAELGKEVEYSEEVRKVVGKYAQIQYINPLTRLSGFYQSKKSFPELTASDYARQIERLFLHKEPPVTTQDLDLYSLTKKCSLRYHCSRGARIEQVIEKFRVHDTASRGYGASVLYSR